MATKSAGLINIANGLASIFSPIIGVKEAKWNKEREMLL